MAYHTKSCILAGAGRGTPEVVILDPAGHKTTVPAKLRQIDEDMWRCEYMSQLTGLHSVNIFYAGNPIAHSPFGVRIAPGKTYFFYPFDTNIL